MIIPVIGRDFILGPAASGVPPASRLAEASCSCRDDVEEMTSASPAEYHRSANPSTIRGILLRTKGTEFSAATSPLYQPATSSYSGFAEQWLGRYA